MAPIWPTRQLLYMASVCLLYEVHDRGVASGGIRPPVPWPCPHKQDAPDMLCPFRSVIALRPIAPPEEIFQLHPWYTIQWAYLGGLELETIYRGYGIFNTITWYSSSNPMHSHIRTMHFK